VEAFERMPRDWTLILAGAADGYRANSILDRIERSSSRDRIRVTGYVDACVLAELYCRASIFAFPSLDEGFGIPVLEAMAHGIPVITSNRSGLVEVAKDAALFVDPLETEELVCALGELIQSPELRSALIVRGLTRAKSFTWERSIRATHGIYEELR
jgi:glycosyltransferase involved in cell wall biosynthesis